MTAAIECGYPHARSELTELVRWGLRIVTQWRGGLCVRV